MSEWKDYIEIEVKDSFDTRDNFKKPKSISHIDIVTITRIRIKFDTRKITKPEIIALIGGKEYIQ
jgi:hypothetical protein